MPEEERCYVHYPGRRGMLDVVGRVPDADLNPGLRLDRLALYHKRWEFDQQSQHQHLDRVIAATGARRNDTSAATILKQWDAFVAGLRGESVTWSQSLLWRLALHLSRATVVENGAICLHRTYGFAYLPGTGLKGLTHAYAMLTGGCQEARRRVFGFQERKEDSSGSVIFLDAWPAKWPQLELDIVNVHHKEYYAEKGGSPPGDWESPSPSYFVAVAPGEVFRFALTTRTASKEDRADLELAKEWLQCALQSFGAGAKTAAGYGYFGEVRRWEPGAGEIPVLERFREQLGRHVQGGCQRQHRSRLWPLLDELARTEAGDLATALQELAEADPSISRSDKYRGYRRVAGLDS